MENYSHLIIDARYFIDHFNKNEYEKYCVELQQHCSNLYSEIENPSTDLQTLASTIIKDLGKNYEGIKGRLKRRNAQDSDHIFCAIFFLPCLMEQHNPACYEFAHMFCECWNAQPFITKKITGPTTIENIVKGFSPTILGFPADGLMGFLKKE